MRQCYGLQRAQTAQVAQCHESRLKTPALGWRSWDGGDINRKGTCLVAWKKACRSKDQGRLGIINLRAHNKALLLKFLDKFYNHRYLPWVHLTWLKLYSRSVPPHECKPKGSFWWKSMIRLAEHFMLSSCSVKSGISTSFQHDTWDFGVLKWQFHELYNFALKKKISVQTFIQSDVEQLLWLPLSITASNELTKLQNCLQNFQLDLHCADIWSYIWGSNAFSIQKAYHKLIGTTFASPWFKWMWQSCYRSRHKFFFWLLLRDRVNTRALLRRKNMHLDSYECVCCNSLQEETLRHLFFECPFSKQCWQSILIHWDLNLTPDSMLLAARQRFNSKIFREVLIIGCWSMWCHRNQIIFDGGTLSLARWKIAFREEFMQLGYRAKTCIKPLLQEFVQHVT